VARETAREVGDWHRERERERESEAERKGTTREAPEGSPPPARGPFGRGYRSLAAATERERERERESERWVRWGRGSEREREGASGRRRRVLGSPGRQRL
jgi:hypothetical protein